MGCCRPLSTDEIEAMKAQCSSPRDRAILSFFERTGYRAAETASLMVALQHRRYGIVEHVSGCRNIPTATQQVLIHPKRPQQMRVQPFPQVTGDSVSQAPVQRYDGERATAIGQEDQWRCVRVRQPGTEILQVFLKVRDELLRPRHFKGITDRCIDSLNFACVPHCRHGQTCVSS
jgi:hypothetical protein